MLWILGPMVCWPLTLDNINIHKTSFLKLLLVLQSAVHWGIVPGEDI